MEEVPPNPGPGRREVALLVQVWAGKGITPGPVWEDPRQNQEVPLAAPAQEGEGGPPSPLQDG